MPLRARLAAAFALAMAVVLGALAVFLHRSMGSALMHGIDQDLRARADLFTAALGAGAAAPLTSQEALIDPDEAFAQVLDGRGNLLASSRGVAAAPMFEADEVARLGGPVLVVRRVVGVDDPVRLLAALAGTPRGEVVVVVGATLGDRNEALNELRWQLLLGVPAALAVATWVAWLVAGAALRPVERLRREAAAITASGLDNRVDVPRTHDELALLAGTLNDLLERLEAAVQREHRFVDDASHELRTPLAVLKGELDLALQRPRSAAELEAALRRAAGEADRLVRLAEDLLVLARSRVGGLPLLCEPVDLRAVLADAVEPFQAGGVSVEAEGTAELDAARVRQAVRNLVDNALRHGAAPVTVSARREDGNVDIVVADAGGGFAPELMPRAAEPFVTGRAHDGGSGLGLAIVAAVADAHGGCLELVNDPAGGARARLRLVAGGSRPAWMLGA